MFCFKRQTTKGIIANPDADYWRVDPIRKGQLTKVKALLKSKGYKIPTKVKNEELSDLYTHCQFGHLRYNACEIEELLKFVEDRALNFSDDTKLAKKVRKENLVQFLQDADDNATFPKFMDLPLELGTTIYGMHCAEFSSFEQPRVPAIAHVSQIVRKEALPIFYEMGTFHMYTENIRLKKPSKAKANTNQPRDLFNDIPADQLAMIRRVMVDEYAQHPENPFKHLEMCGWSFDLNPKLKRHVTFHGCPRSTPKWQMTEENTAYVTEALEEEIKSIVDRKGRGHLIREDLPEIKRVFIKARQEKLEENQARAEAEDA